MFSFFPFLFMVSIIADLAQPKGPFFGKPSMDSPGVMGAGFLSSSTEPDHPVPVKKFYQGEPVALGISQIFLGITGIAFASLVNAIDDSVFLTKIPYWGGILYVISGSLAVAAARNPKIPLVKGMLAMNVISAITAGVGIVLLSFILGSIHPFSFAWNCNYNGYDTKENCAEIENIGKGILVVLTVFTILEFCIAISVASFGCNMLCRDPFAETVVVIYQNVTPANAEQHPPFDCKQPVIHP